MQHFDHGCKNDRHSLRDDSFLYGIIDLGYVTKEGIEDVAAGLLDGGVGVLQFRAKGLDGDGVLQVLSDCAPGLAGMSRSYGVPLIINDFPEVAAAIGADGVHVGQDDGSLEDVRKVVGDKMIVGRSTHSLEQAREALREGFDYIGFGPLFPTPTKEGRPGIGTEDVAVVESEVGARIPVFCIGGIKPDNLELVLASGARRVVIVSALLQAENIRSATRSVSRLLNPDS